MNLILIVAGSAVEFDDHRYDLEKRYPGHKFRYVKSVEDLAGCRGLSYIELPGAYRRENIHDILNHLKFIGCKQEQYA